MIVVSDTSALTNLAAIGEFDLLRRLFTDVHIPRGVYEELNAHGESWPGAAEVKEAGWSAIHEPQDRTLVAALRRDLGRGEAESIALALELRAALILLDEREGRHAARELGLRPLGVVGILLQAKSGGLIDVVRPRLHALRDRAGFYLRDSLVEAVLAEAGET